MHYIDIFLGSMLPVTLLSQLARQKGSPSRFSSERIGALAWARRAPSKCFRSNFACTRTYARFRPRTSIQQQSSLFQVVFLL